MLLEPSLHGGLRLLWALKEPIMPFFCMNIWSHWEHCSSWLSVGPNHVYNDGDDFCSMQGTSLLSQAAWDADYPFYEPQTPQRIVLWHLAQCHVMGTNKPLTELWRLAQGFLVLGYSQSLFCHITLVSMIRPETDQERLGKFKDFYYTHSTLGRT